MHFYLHKCIDFSKETHSVNICHYITNKLLFQHNCLLKKFCSYLFKRILKVLLKNWRWGRRSFILICWAKEEKSLFLYQKNTFTAYLFTKNYKTIPQKEWVRTLLRFLEENTKQSVLQSTFGTSCFSYSLIQFTRDLF